MRPIRLSMINGLFHITTRCDNKNFYFQEDEDFTEYLKVLEKAREKYGFKLHAYCLTRNHVHLLLSTPTEDNLSTLMQYINGQYAKNYNRRHKRTGHFWGERFYSTIIESETQLLNSIFYIELNMTRNGVTKHPKDWKWSSYNQHSGCKGPIKIDYHEVYLRLSSTAQDRQKKYTSMMEEKMVQKGLLSRQPQVTYGLIFGSESFVKEVIIKCSSHKYYKNRKTYSIDQETYCLRKFKT
ncbi:REP-associated tyrosine transposase [Candidatus Uabimicrobium amorphum]|uniref:Transposase n=1 Tax=Uabimicrobium amorphum TaxID=2596890 RepID=A0A5S9IJA8_UABAM|nr:transposase [Candidatus Uabimicrobium amorphum]BBM82883.1 transposase [Candidatus Uabimicrobium amorphum]